MKVKSIVKKELSSEKVSMTKRGIAAVLDMIISAVLSNIPILLIYGIVTGETQLPNLSSLSISGGMIICLLGILMFLFYYVVLPVYKYNGQTLMKRVFGFKVVKSDGSNIDLRTMLKRELLGSMVIEGGFVTGGEYFKQLILIITGSNPLYKVLLYISYALSILSLVLMAFTIYNKALHDFIAGTKVVGLKK